MGRRSEQTLNQKGIQMANQHMIKCSTSYITDDVTQRTYKALKLFCMILP